MKNILTDRLILRNFAGQDAPDLMAYLHEPRTSCFLAQKLQTIEDAQKEAAKRRKSDATIAVCLKSTGQVIGELFSRFEKPDTYSLGWHFNADFGGAGYAFEAARAFFHHLFSQKAARRVYAYVEDDNARSRRLCEKLGMRYEGLFKEFISFCMNADGDPIYVNTMQYALLHHEWTTPGMP